MKELLKKLNRYFKNLLKRIITNKSKIVFRFLFLLELSFYLFLFLPFLYINRVLPASKRIFFARFRSSRIGHFTVGFYIRYAKVKLNIYKQKCLYCFDDQISNFFIKKQVKRQFFVNRIVKFILVICKKLPGLECLIDYEPERAARDIEGFIQSEDMPKFTERENNFCVSWLKSYGWEGPNQKIVCIHLRDSAYLNDFFKNSELNKINWDYHSYRNSNIDDFDESINWLIKKDVFIIRTGKLAEKKSNINSTNLLDYPFCEDKKDILDVWFFANADLVITTGSGVDEIAAAYKVPRIFVNLLPIIDTPTSTKSLTISKHLYWEKNKKHLSFEEYIDLNKINCTEQFIEKGIIIKSLSSQELKEVIIDGWQYFLENKKIKYNDYVQTNKYKTLIKKYKNLDSHHKFFNENWVMSANLFLNHIT